MTHLRLVLTTAGSHAEAQRIADALVERKLAACVNIVTGIESVYRWQEKIERSAEWLLLIKTTASAFLGVRDAIKELHSYDVPECICMVIENGDDKYMKWIFDSVR
jgi:periplasmic divalent cation tolerance protein